MHPCPATTSIRALRALAVLVLLTLAALGALIAPQTAAAAGSPNLSLAVDAQDSVLYGTPGSVRLTASIPGAAATPAYNLSYRVILPSGVTYTAGSAGALAGEPTKIEGQPGTGQTTLLWVDLTDLAPGTSHSLDFTVGVVPGFSVQNTYTITGGAYAHDTAARVPAFTLTGASDTSGPNPRTAFVEGITDMSRFGAMSVTKSTDATPDDELLRGVHDHQTVHTLTVRTGSTTMTSVSLFDYLPAGIEFLGCGGAGADHTTNAPTNPQSPASPEEYPGAGPILVSPVGGCVTPTTVQTSTFDPDGTGTAFASGVYTQVRWNLSTLTANTTTTIKYKAAIPLRRNVAAWPLPVPSVSSGAQGANLNNNSGTEVLDEEALVSFTNVVGFFNGSATLSLSSDTTTRRFAEDLSVVKRARSSALAQGTETLWDLTLATSEYRAAGNVVVTDTLPDGLCPLQAGATLTQSPSALDDSECGSTPGTGPTPSEPYASATELTSGQWTVVWNQTSDAALAELAPSTQHIITFPTRARSAYQEAYGVAGPIASSDAVDNSVALSGSARVVCASGLACPSGSGTPIAHDGPLSQAVADVSSDRLTAAGATLDQRVASTSGDCSTATYTDGAPVPAYRPGDRICWLLTAAYPGSLASFADAIIDYLPSSLLYDQAFGSFGEVATGNDTVGASAVDFSAATPGPGGELRWSLPAPYVTGPKGFERRIATRVQLPMGAVVGDRSSNVVTSSTTTTAGANVPLRDATSYQLSMPVVSTQKRVVALNGVDLTTPVATQVVRGGDIAKFRLQLSNASDDTTAERAEVWDRLAGGVTCADVAASGVPISNGGTCDAGDDTVKWGDGGPGGPGPDVPASSSTNLTYSVRVPTTTRPTQALTSSAGIREFFTTTNTNGTFTYVPASNIDPTHSVNANVGPATSSATLTGAEPAVTQSRTTSITESESGVEFNANSEATIGETITYQVNARIPAGITVEDLRVVDAVDARHIFLPGTLALSAGGPLPGGASLTSDGANVITLALGASWTAPTGADTTFSFTFDAIVADSTATFRTGLPMTNRADLGYLNPAGSPVRNAVPGAVVTTTVVEPVVTVDKVSSVGTSPVIGGQDVGYTVKVTAGAGASNPAHNTTLVDRVEPGLTPLDLGGDPVVDGAITQSGGVWNEAARTITFPMPLAINPGTTVTRTYVARVDIPPVGGQQLKNTATARTTSIAGTPSLPAMERTSASTRNAGYVHADEAILSAKTASVASAVVPTLRPSGASEVTPGEQTTHTVTVTIPPNVEYYDMYVRDSLPPELQFDAHVSQVCTAGCLSGATTPTVQMYTPFSSGGNTQVVAWDLGDLPTFSSVTRTIELTYRAHLRLLRRGGTLPAAEIKRPQSAVTTSSVASNRTDRVGAFNAGVVPVPSGLPTAAFDDTSPVANATLTTVEPVLGIDKAIAVGAGAFGTTQVVVHDGDVTHHRITVRNVGDAPAYDVEVRDVPHVKLRNVTPVAGPSTTTLTDAWAAPGDDLTWTIPTIAPNGTVVLEYSADLPVVTDMRDGDTFPGTTTIQHGYGVAAADRALRPGPAYEYREYSVVTIPALTRTTSAIYDAPTISVNKTTGIAPGFPDNAPTEVEQPFTWRVTVANLSPTAAGKSLTVKDTLPRDWAYIPGSAAFTSGSTADPTIVASPTGDQLTWSTSIPLAPLGFVVLTYRAKPLRASATSIGTGTAPAARHINTATATVLNSLDKPADAGGLFAPAQPDTSYATLAVPVISVVTTPDAGTGIAGNAVEAFIKVRNTGSLPATNVEVTATLPTDGIANTYAAGSATRLPTSIAMTETSASDTAVKLTLPTLAAGATVDIRLPLRTDPAAPDNTDLTIPASVLTDQTPAVVDDAVIRLTGNADLQATKTAPAAVAAGQALTYTVGAKNLGPSVARDLVLSDDVPPAVAPVVSQLPTGCTFSTTTRRVTCTFPGITAPGASVSAVIPTRVRPGATTHANNTVVASSTTFDPVALNSAASVLVDVGEIADLSVSTTITGGSPGATPTDPWRKRVDRGDPVELKHTFVNEGPSDAAGATLVTTLPAGLTYVSSAAGCAYDAPTRKLTCTLPGGLLARDNTEVPPVGAPQTITVQTVASAHAPAPKTVSTTITGGATAEPTPTDNTATALVSIDPNVRLTVDATAPTTVTPGEIVEYTLTGTNSGKDDATGVTFTQTLPAGVVFESADPGCTFGAPATVTCTVASIAGTGSSIAGTGPSGPTIASTDPSSSAAPGQAVRHVRVRVPFALADQSFISQIRVTSTETDSSPTDAAVAGIDDVGVTAGPAADLSVAQQAPADITAGGSVTYTVTVRNDGPSSATNVAVTDTLPAGVTFVSASSSAGPPCSVVLRVVTCNLGTLTAGTSSVLTFTVTVPEHLGGQTVTNAASVHSPVVDPTPANATSGLARAITTPPIPPTPAPVEPPVVEPPAGEPDPAPPALPIPPTDVPPVVGTANLALAKQAEGIARAGRELTYTISATNRGPAIATDVVVTDALIGGVDFKHARAAKGTCGYERGTVRCSVGDLKAGESVNMKVIVVPSSTGTIVNNAVLSSAVTDPNMADNRAVAQNTVSPLPQTKLSVRMQASSAKLRGGQRVSYKLKVKNIGSHAAKNIEVCDRLPIGMAFTSTRGGVLKGSRLCFTVPSLAPGKTATVKVGVRLSARARRGTITNRFSADAENAVVENASAKARVVTDGKVDAKMVRGFTG